MAHKNPWHINSIYELQYFNCPCCEYREKSKQVFINHAFEKHPEAVDSLTTIQDGSLNDVVIDIPANYQYIKTEEAVMEPVVEIETVAFDEKENEPSKEDEATEVIIPTYACEMCNKLFTKLGKLQRHIRRAHKTWKLYQCQKCNHSATSLSEIENHIKNDHQGGDTDHQYSVTGKIFIKV